MVMCEDLSTGLVAPNTLSIDWGSLLVTLSPSLAGTSEVKIACTTRFFFTGLTGFLHSVSPPSLELVEVTEESVGSILATTLGFSEVNGLSEIEVPQFVSASTPMSPTGGASV